MPSKKSSSKSSSPLRSSRSPLRSSSKVLKSSQSPSRSRSSSSSSSSSSLEVKALIRFDMREKLLYADIIDNVIVILIYFIYYRFFVKYERVLDKQVCLIGSDCADIILYIFFSFIIHIATLVIFSPGRRLLGLILVYNNGDKVKSSTIFSRFWLGAIIWINTLYSYDYFQKTLFIYGSSPSQLYLLMFFGVICGLTALLGIKNLARHGYLSALNFSPSDTGLIDSFLSIRAVSKEDRTRQSSK